MSIEGEMASLSMVFQRKAVPLRSALKYTGRIFGSFLGQANISALSEVFQILFHLKGIFWMGWTGTR